MMSWKIVNFDSERNARGMPRKDIRMRLRRFKI